jgi:hypothetical protein
MEALASRTEDGFISAMAIIRDDFAFYPMLDVQTCPVTSENPVPHNGMEFWISIEVLKLDRG